MQGPNELATEWLARADDDELSIKAILKEEGAPSTVCFLSQQMAEKLLKGMLTCFKKPVPKIHDLLEFETVIFEFDESVKSIHEELSLLNRYYIETRYPGDYPTFSWDDARESFQAALWIKEYVHSKILNE